MNLLSFFKSWFKPRAYTLYIDWGEGRGWEVFRTYDSYGAAAKGRDAQKSIDEYSQFKIEKS